LCQFLDLREDPSPHVHRYSFGKTNVSHACIFEQLVELDFKAAMCFAVVKGKEVFSQLPRFVTFGHGRILDHQFD